MNRRALLAGTGMAIATLAGCARETKGGGRTGTLHDGTTEATRSATVPQRLALGESATLDDGTSLRVADPTVQASVIADHSEFLSIEREEGLQFVVVDVTGDAPFEPSSFLSKRNGDILPPPQTPHRIRGVTRACGGTCISVPVEAESVRSAGIAYRVDEEISAVWDLDDATVTALSHVPDLRLRGAVISDEGGDVGIEFTVDNVGKRDGVFLALVIPARVADVEEPVGFPVPPDETVVETVVPSEVQGLDPDEAAFTEQPTEDTRRFEIESRS